MVQLANDAKQMIRITGSTHFCPNTNVTPLAPLVFNVINNQTEPKKCQQPERKALTYLKPVDPGQDWFSCSRVPASQNGGKDAGPIKSARKKTRGYTTPVLPEIPVGVTSEIIQPVHIKRPGEFHYVLENSALVKSFQ